MATDFYQTIYGDTVSTLDVTLQRDGVPINLTGVVTMRISNKATGFAETLTMDVIDAPLGQAQRDWADGWPTGGAGEYEVQYVHTIGNVAEVIPSTRGPYTILIRPAL